MGSRPRDPNARCPQSRSNNQALRAPDISQPKGELSRPCIAAKAGRRHNGGRTPMNAPLDITRLRSTCPHDCPSCCALDVEVLAPGRIGRVHGSKEQTYTAGIVCAKVARYAERVHHPERLLYPLKRVGPKGSGQFERISWE